MHLLYSDIMLYIIKCILKIMEHCEYIMVLYQNYTLPIIIM